MAKVPRRRIAQVIAARTHRDGGVQKKYAQEVAAYLLESGRVRELDSLLRDVSLDWAEQGYIEAIARSAYPISATVNSDIKAQVTKLFPKADKVVVTNVIDPSVIGGVQISIANQQLDLSVEAKLNKFKQLTEAA